VFATIFDVDRGVWLKWKGTGGEQEEEEEKERQAYIRGRFEDRHKER
jgi:hypothetical protein